MPDLYASAIGTTVLQLKEIPERPAEYDGQLALYELAQTSEAQIRAAFESYGTITKVELGGGHPPAIVHFTTHAAAEKAAAAGAPVCKGQSALFNELPYDEKGWCVPRPRLRACPCACQKHERERPSRASPSTCGRCSFEDSVSTELLVRLVAYPRMLAELNKLPPKVLSLTSEKVAEARYFDLGSEALSTRVDRVVARIEGATFGNPNDKNIVPNLYKDYVKRIAGVLQNTLSIAARHETRVEVPPMPVDASMGQLREWHLSVLRARHGQIADALSGRVLDTIEECVPIKVEGEDASGKRLDVRNAQGVSEWLRRLHDGNPGARCALLTAGPAAGKTWLLSQVIVHSLGGPLLPILIKVELLQKRLRENALGDDDWIDGYLRLECEPPHYRMLQQAMAEGRALVLLDGLDEAGGARERIERHLAEAFAQRGLVTLCTSRPTGLSDVFKAFHRLQLAPLTDAQQARFLEKRLGAELTARLAPYLSSVPIDEEGRRITANPLLLSMVASIAELRQGVGMPDTTAELYEVAAGAMLSRAATPLSDDAKALLQATLFQAHAAEQRIVTEAHLEEAAASPAGLRDTAKAAGELRSLVLADQLPLLRLLQPEPLQMQAFHLSFQEFYAMRAVSAGAPLPAFAWGVWWSNAVRMGVQTGDSFGDKFADAAGLPAGEAWQMRVAQALVERGLPAAWLPTMVEVARGKEEAVSTCAASIADRDVVRVGRRVLAVNSFGHWQSGQVTRAEARIDVNFGTGKNEGLPPTKALVVNADGVGALLRAAAGAGQASLVDALLEKGVSPLVADERANTPLHLAAASGSVSVCRSLRQKGADEGVHNAQGQPAG